MIPPPTAILCVDDESMVLSSLRTLLSKQLSLVSVIETAQSGAEALEVLAELQEDGIDLAVVISDYTMPDMRGDQLLVKIHEISPETKKIMLTGQSSVEGVTRAINEAGLYRFMEKPWVNEDMVLTLQAAVAAYVNEREIKRQNKELKKLNEELELKVKERTAELERLSITDCLTGLYNRYKIDSVLEDEVIRADRYESSWGVILLDIDHFKKVNDTYGHQIGDQVLIKIAWILQKSTRVTDIVGRWGGEEFIVVCPETDLSGLLTLAEKLRLKIESYHFPMVGQKTSSFGVAMYVKNQPLKTLVSRADNALYEAKSNGRNQVVQAP